MLGKFWKYYPDQCEHCGDDLEVFTQQTDEGWVEDEDPVRCVECGLEGVMQVWDRDDIRIKWHLPEGETLGK